MSDLYLLRHGIAVPHGTPGIAEPDRPLTATGKLRLAEIAKGLKRLGVQPDRIVASPLVRAARTAEIVADVLGRKDRLETAEVLQAGSPAGGIRDWLGSRSEERLMLVGHNPNLTELLGLLIGQTCDPLPFELKKGGVAALRTTEPGRYRLQWLATPRLIRRLRGD